MLLVVTGQIQVGFGGATHNHTGSLFALQSSFKAVDVQRTVKSLHAVTCPAVLQTLQADFKACKPTDVRMSMYVLQNGRT